jgi:rhamnulokinase
MKPDRIAVFLPCHSLDDFPTWLDDHEADDLLAACREEHRQFRSLVDPDYPAFHSPDNMVAEIERYCARTGQPVPDSPGAFTRCILESLAFKYRYTMDSLEELTGTPLTEIKIIGGGSKNRMLNQFTADATGRVVLAGPVEATALGNIAVQMLATGAVSSLAEARAAIARSFPSDRYQPAETDRWDREYARFRGLVAG